MQLETPRLILRNFAENDAWDLFEILGDEETMRYCEPAYTFEKTRAFLSSFCIARQGAIAAVRKDSGKMIGYILFSELESGLFEIGWFFNRNVWRQNFAYESCRAVIDFAFSERNAHKVIAETIDLEKSVRLMQKLGMQLDEIQHHQTTDLEGRPTDLYCYSISKEDWKKSTISN